MSSRHSQMSMNSELGAARTCCEPAYSDAIGKLLTAAIDG